MSSVRRRRYQSMREVPLFYAMLFKVELLWYALPIRGRESRGMLEAFAMSDKGCVRSNNEDYCLIEPERGLYVLADGMGGAKAGERASRLAVDTVAEVVHSAPRLDSQVLLTAVEEANRQGLSAAPQQPHVSRL